MALSTRFRESIMILTAITALFCFGRLAFGGDDVVLQDQRFPTAFGGTLTIDTPAGEISIENGDDNEAVITIRGDEKIADEMTFTFDASQDRIKVKAKKKHASWRMKNMNLSYDIRLPRRYNIDLETGGGKIEISDMEGEFSLKTAGGEIELDDCGGALRAKTAGGHIDVADFIGSMELKTAGGSIDCQDCQGDLDAETAGGSIELEAANGAVKAKTSAGTISLSYAGPNHGIDLVSSAGSITLEVPHDLKADLDLSTSAGDIQCDLPVSATQSKSFISSKLEGKLNGGGEVVRCRTSAGSINVSSLRL